MTLIRTGHGKNKMNHSVLRKMKSGLLTLAALILLLPLFRGSGRAESMRRRLTLMVYMCGSNLESQYGSASADYLEMTEAGVEADVSVLVMMGGSSDWKIAVDAEKTVTMEIGSRGVRRVREEEKKNMGSGDTLADLLRYGRERCPADQYALILWDHGGGPLDGLCWDEQYNADHLSLKELTGALRDAGFSGEENRLAWIGFDACLMSSVEVGATLAPYAGYMVSSQAEEPASGWNYAFLNGLRGDADAAETGRRIIETYFEGQEDSARELTLACVDLSAMEEVTGRMNDFFSGLSGELNEESFPDISRMRINAVGFGRAGDQQPGENGYDLVDLVSLTESYATRNPEKAEALIQAVRRAVIHHRSNPESSCGLSVYHPWRNREKYRSAWRELYAGMNFCPGYTRYISAYGRIMIGEQLVRWTGLNRVSAEPDPAGSLSWITAELTAEQMADLAGAHLVILARNLYDTADESYVQIYRSDEVRTEGNRLLASYDGRHIRAVNASGYVELTGALAYQMTENGIFQIRLYPFDEEGRRAEQPVIAEYIQDAGNRFSLRDYLVYDEMTGAWSSRAEVDLSRYAGVTFYNEYRNPTVNGQEETLAFEQWRPDEHEDTQKKARYDVDRTDFMMAFGKDLMRAEALYAGFEITDTQGNRVMTALTPLEEGGAAEYPVSVSEDGLPTLENGRTLRPDCSLYLLKSANPDSARIILNVSLRNETDQDLSFLLTDVSLNGAETELSALNAQGRGAADQYGRKSLAPGETGAASLVIRLRDIIGLVPDVSLGKVNFSLFLGAVEDGTNRLYQVLPFELRTDIPLTAFYPETDLLPPAFLIEAGREIGSLSAETEKTLFSRGECRVSLRGCYIVDRNVILLLHYENGDGVSRHVFLGHAKMDGREAAIGQTRDPGAESRNRRISVYAPDQPAWKLPEGVYRILKAGETADEYVALKPADGAQTEVRTLSFQALWYDVDHPTDAVCFSEAVISTEEAAPLADGQLAVAPAEDYTVTEGKALPAEAGSPVFTDQPWTVSGGRRTTIRIAGDAEDPLLAGYYALFRRYASDAELASVNIMNATDEQTGEPVLSFRNHSEWLAYEALGQLAPDQDGGLSAVFPGRLPTVRGTGGSVRLAPTFLYFNEEGQVLWEQIGSHLGFHSLTFPGAVLETALGYLSFRLDPESGRAALADFKQIDGAWPSLAEMATQPVFMISADAGEQELLQFLNGDLFDTPRRLRQYLLKGGEKLSFDLEPVTDPEKYEVVFLCVTEGNRLFCTRPVPLTDFME